MSFAQGGMLALAIPALAGLAAITVVGVMSLIFEQQIELWEATVLSGLAVGALVTTFAVLGSSWFIVALTAQIGLCVGVYWLNVSSRRSAIRERQFLAQDEGRALAAIDTDYTNAAAHSFLGDVCRKQGKYDQALEAYRVAQSLVGSLPGEQEKLTRAIERTEEEQAHMRRCPHCAERIPRRAPICPHCGGRMAWFGWIVPDDPQEARRFRTAVLLSLLGFVAAGLLHHTTVGWWAWLGLLVWIALLVIATARPEEIAQAPGPQPQKEVNAVIEEEHDEP